jgi:adenosylcobinamide-GDP ribazoletransferase
MTTPVPMLRRPLAAVAFLTRVPVGRHVAVGPGDVASGAPVFPLVGGLIGAVCGSSADLLAGPLPPLVAGAIAVGIGAALTGAMHLDALADTADALGGRSRQHALEIMRDHAVGAFGVVALVLVCLVDAAVLASLADENDATLIAVGAFAAARAAMLPHAMVLPYARPGAGQGRMLEKLGTWPVAIGVALAVALALPSGRAGVAGLAAAATVALALGLCWRRWLGGVTGDTFGATVKLAETAFLLVALVVVG